MKKYNITIWGYGAEVTIGSLSNEQIHLIKSKGYFYIVFFLLLYLPKKLNKMTKNHPSIRLFLIINLSIHLFSCQNTNLNSLEALPSQITLKNEKI